MAKLNKKTMQLVVGGGIVAVLAIALLLLLLLPTGGEEDNSSSAASSGSTAVTLVSQKQADVKNIHVKNENGEYDIVLTGDKVWEIEALKDFAQNTNLYSQATNEIATVKASSILLEQQEDLDKYGLDEPSTVVTATFADGTTFRMNIGGTAPTTGGNYMTVEGKDPIYIYNGASYFDYDLTDYVSTTIFDIESTEPVSSTTSGSSSSSTVQIVEEMEITRKDWDKPLLMKEIPEEDASYAGTIKVSGIYQMYSPAYIFVDDSKIGTTVTGFMNLSASGVEVIKPTDAEIKERGLDDPAATVRVVFEGRTYTLKIGNAITCESTEDLNALDSNHVHSTIGYNVMRDGVELIYNVAEASLPWLTMKAENIMSSLVLLPNIMEVKTVTVTFDGQTHSFELNKTVNDEDKEVLEPVYNGNKELSDDSFRSYYQVLLKVYQSGVNTGEAVGAPVMTIQYDYLDTDKEPDKLEFFDNGTGGYIMSRNGDMAFVTKVSYVNSVKDATAQIIQNQEVIS